MNKLLVGNKSDLTTKKVVDYTTAKVTLTLLFSFYRNVQIQTVGYRSILKLLFVLAKQLVVMLVSLIAGW